MTMATTKIRADWRVTIPSSIRDKFGLTIGKEVIFVDEDDKLVLVPVEEYEKPTEALEGSVKGIVDRPKQFARDHIRSKLLREHE